ncbi:TRAPPII-specific subunit TRS120 KNAG_0C04490 [Huiozyma naganishii CBS 8797]|uniref:Uncharacterized protein n=1 Tax=Huiozyma naganishii (strain ATCC MYA-139 / BCRC 22969 / CBS 8797 / KCTC 17520 / NBRC 10181 / NCYC 3082 / Yp74L-3) TaxID=1071383 RepID=J7S661_HUIN7|nr:hypothetical protein KNAG_0C04490 [Kazachstania naganishii CBS 8797]CCK69551.1 hypothetical protein KNAG_0C04490 [Kazachstania naganishii CBS 8797]
MNSLVHYPSFVDPCQIRTLVVPIGRWKWDDCELALENLKRFNEIRLLDITPLDSPLFNPQGFPQGRLFFQFNSLGHTDETDLFLCDFEPFRKQFVVIGLVNDDSDPVKNMEILREKYATTISHSLIYFNSKNVSEKLDDRDPRVFHIKSFNEMEKRLETIICDIGRSFLLSLNHYYSSYKHVTLRSPGIIGGNSIMKMNLTKYGDDVLSGKNSLRNTSSNAAASQSANSKRLSSFELTTNSIKKSASIKLASTLSTSDSRAQQRARGRQLKILGNFQLLAGKYLDALNSFTEAAELLHKIRDLLWLGSALDGVAISFLLLSYLQISFCIPEIVNKLCPVEISSPEEKSVNDTTPKATTPRTSTTVTPMHMKSPRNSIVANVNPTMLELEVDKVNLPKLIQLISNKILYYYELSVSHNSEYAPQVVYCNLLLRILTFMVSARSATSTLSTKVLQSIINPQSSTTEPLPADDFTNTHALEVYRFSNRLFELDLAGMSIEAQIGVYNTLANVYHLLGYNRKKGFALLLLLQTLLQDKKTKSFKWHPAYRELLKGIMHLYKIDSNTEPLAHNEDDNWLKIQKKVICLCRDVAEKVGDFSLCAKMALLLISKHTFCLTTDNQESILKDYILPSIKQGEILQYWDPCILRSVELRRLETNDPTNPDSEFPRERSILDDQKLKSVAKPHMLDTHEVFNPFKHLTLEDDTSNNATNKSDDAAGISTSTIFHKFILGDNIELACNLQNPFDFEVIVTKIELTERSREFCQLGQNTVTEFSPFILKPRSMTTLSFPLILQKSTSSESHILEALDISVFNLPLQEFKIIFDDTKSESGMHRYTYNAIDMKIIPEQPHLELINDSSAAENCVMVLDGTTTRLPLRLNNKSLGCEVDYIKFSTITNIEKELKPDYWRKLSPDKLYNFELGLRALKQSCIKIIDQPTGLKPNEGVNFAVDLDVMSVPLNFNKFDLIIEYGMKGSSEKLMYVKELKVTYDVTVRKAIEVPSLDVIPISETFKQDVGADVDWAAYLQKQLTKDKNLRVNDFALVLVDFRNSWIDGITLQAEFDDFSGKSYMVETEHTLRIIIPVRKIANTNNVLSEKPIPTVVTNRQFIRTNLTDEQIMDVRERFWCREYILDRLKCKWHFSHDKNVGGLVDARKFLDVFDNNIVAALYEGKFPYHINVNLDKESLKVGEHLKATVNVSPVKDNSTLGELPSIILLNVLIFDNRTSKLLSKSNRRILYNGLSCKSISGGTATETTFDFLPIETGQYQICACLSRSDDRDTVIQLDHSIVIFNVL